MSLTSAEITDLLRRAQLSVVRGYTIARADYYARELGGSDESPAALVELCRAALGAAAPAADGAPKLTEGKDAATPRALPEEASPGEPQAASPEPPAGLESTPATPEPSAPAEEAAEDDTAEDYESWSKKKLLAAATERGLDVNAHNTKAEIIAALRA